MPDRRALAAIAAGVVGLLAVVAASLAERVEVFSRPAAPERATRLPTTVLTTASRPAPASSVPPAESDGPNVLLGLLAQALAVVAALLLLALLALGVQALLRRRPRLVAEPQPGFGVPEVPEELLRSSGARRALLETGEPRNAIVAAWLDLEESARATGLPRHPSETSTEYTERVLGTWSVDALAITGLAQLYREARFSHHELGEPERQRALAALDVLHRDLQQVASGLMDAPTGREGRA